MSLREKYNTRSLLYSRWHRPESIGRFITKPEKLSMIDLDSCEYDDATGSILVFVETAQDVGQGIYRPDKCTRIMEKLCDDHKHQPPGWLVLFTPNCKNTDIAGFRVRQVYPSYGAWETLTPAEWAVRLTELRDKQNKKRRGAYLKKKG